MNAKLLSIQFCGAFCNERWHRQIYNFTPRNNFSSFEFFFIILFRRVKHLNRSESKCYDRKHKLATKLNGNDAEARRSAVELKRNFLVRVIKVFNRPTIENNPMLLVVNT